MRRVEWWLAAGLVFLASAAAYLGSRSARDEELTDRRLSTYLRGPSGARGMAETLEGLGVSLVRRERAWFTVTDPEPGTLYAFLHPDLDLADRERLRVTQLAARGGHVALAGHTGLESCFGLSREGTEPIPTVAMAAGVRLDLPPAQRSYRLTAVEAVDPDCGGVRVRTVDTLLVLSDGAPLAIRANLEGGGSAALVADPQLLTNQTLRETDVGLVLIPWWLEPGIDRVVVDEYHHGFGAGGSLWRAAWNWLRTSPPGWTILQLAAATVLALFALGARFGPPLPYRREVRRSELEHVNALGAGLQNAGGHQTAVELLLGGLRRRLGRTEPRPGDLRAWLEGFTHIDHPEARAALETLTHLNQHPAATRVRTAADAVEDLWTALTTRQRSTS